MKYVSTRGQSASVSSSQAIIQGIAPDGGLYLPESIPLIDAEEWRSIYRMDYRQTAEHILSKFLTDFSPEQIRTCVDEAYTPEHFNGGTAPVVQLNNGVCVLELWHGPTCAFKDMALQLMPHLFVTAMDIQKDSRHALILVATSGDTGKAALEGFRDVPGTSVAVLYPNDGVSAIQRRQMTTQQGSNVAVAAINGNFDDAQKAVKRIFKDKAFAELMAQKNVFLSSANSINWGRLVPQIIYYIHACAKMKNQGILEPEQVVDISVPTGNFGNILAAYYAKRMGAPIGRLLCASNSNNVLTDFLQTGTYNANRDFYKTISPSMDILVSSNLERLIYLIAGGDGVYISSLMAQLEETGQFAVSERIKTELDADFAASWCDDQATMTEVSTVWQRQRYLLDPHTAVAFYAARQLSDCAPVLVVSTASPYKFASDVLHAIGERTPHDSLQSIKVLQDATGIPVPSALDELSNLPERFDTVLQTDEIDKWLKRLWN